MGIATNEERPVSELDYRQVSSHLFAEARLLDNGNLDEWLSLLSEDVRYRLIAPTMLMERGGTPQAGQGVILMDETIGSLKTRIQQLGTPSYTVAENPRSFTRRFVANIEIDSINSDGLIQVHSNVLVYRSRASQMEPHLFSMSRDDTLRRVNGKLYLARREARLDESVVGSRNISTLF